MKANSMVFPELEIKEFIIRDELSKAVAERHTDAFVLRSSNIIHRIKVITQAILSYEEIVYVKTARRGYWKGIRRFNLGTYSPVNAKTITRSFYIMETFRTINQVKKDISQEEKAREETKQQVNKVMQSLLCNGPYNKQIILEADMLELYHISTEQITPVELIAGQSEYIHNYKTHLTNNLQLEFDIAIKDLHCLIRWYKCECKIYRAIQYLSNNFAIDYQGRFIGANKLTTSSLLLMNGDGYGGNPSAYQMKTKRLWIVDTTQPGLTRSQYKHQRRRQQVTADNMKTYLEEALRDITYEELDKAKRFAPSSINHVFK